MAQVQKRAVETVVGLDRNDYLAMEAQQQTSYELGQIAVGLSQDNCPSKTCELQADVIPSPWHSVRFSCGALACGDVSVCQQIAPDVMIGVVEQLRTAH